MCFEPKQKVVRGRSADSLSSEERFNNSTMATRLITDSFKQTKSSTQREARKEIKPTVGEKIEAKDEPVSGEEKTRPKLVLVLLDQA